MDNFTKSEHKTPKNTLTSSVFCHNGRKIEHRNVDKPNRTKETLTKTTETKESGTTRVFFLIDESRDSAHSLNSLFNMDKIWDQANLHQLPIRMQQFIAFYIQRYARHFPNSAVPVIFSSALKRLNGVLANYSKSELEELLDRFFICELPNVKQQWYSLEAFVHNVDVLEETEL